MGRRPGVRRRQPPKRHSQRQQGRAGDRGHDAERCQGQRRGHPPDLLRHGRDGGLGLGGEDDALRTDQARAQIVPRPGEDRIPGLRLRLHQRHGLARPVAQQVRARIFHDLGPHLLHLAHHAVQRRIDDAGERHGGGVDEFALGVPLRRQSLRQRLRGGADGQAARGMGALAIEDQREAAFPLLRGRLLVEAARQHLLQIAPRHGDGIDGLPMLGQQLIDQIFSHGNHVALRTAWRQWATSMQCCIAQAATPL